MALKSALAAVAVLALLTSCGTRANDPLLNIVRGFASGLLNRGDEAAAPAPSPRDVLTRDVINEAAVPLILIESVALGASAAMGMIAVNGSNETWQGNEDITLTLSREGVLRATRGLGYDLYVADIDATRAALRERRSGTVQRLHVAVDGGTIEEDRRGYACEIGFGAPVAVNIVGVVRNLTPATESCIRRTTGESFENRYWIDGEGFAWASEQWVGPELGHFRIERLHR